METQLKSERNGQINIVLQDRHIMRSHHESVQQEQKKDPFTNIDQAFTSFIGLHDLKQSIKEIYAVKMINEKRGNFGLKHTNQVLHMLFKGNPGTGKTTMARKLAELYHNMNLLSKGHLIEAERADLVGEYIGQTAQKTKAIVKKAMGGILFVDEAYSLGRGGEKDFGKEAIDTLVKHMEDHHNDFVLILAGYPYEMERFLTLNPGLKSRFPFIVEFKDYDTEQLIEIAERMAQEREYKLTREAKWVLKAQIKQELLQKKINFANARYIRNIIEHAIRMQAMRLMMHNHVSHEDLIHLTAPDFKLDTLKSLSE
ncbi:Stage V sporulation protein [Lentibacillus sp. JNUCC-1]|uniref:AAA family ATPase n=1 Tax=Lentibacillus sp. JNUCC-1 TaxID=2654513 RepID=UPI0012E870AE|nr:AAA family ATPase [Lentibacillus sp. JNUCC-1]MUV39877.1 Stage V sporulation protein [Lentibacillus sp. JNUCC-1]